MPLGSYPKRPGLVWQAALLACAVANSEPARSHPRTFDVEASTTRGILRAFGQPGDFGLRNDGVNAVVRKSDGWLVDFWPRRATVPTVAALGENRHVDGLWMLEPEVDDGRTSTNVEFRHVAVDHDRITATTTVKLRSGPLEVSTVYRLDGDEPALLIETSFETSNGPGHRHFGFQERVRWGNVDTFVDGVRRIFRYDGKARSIGRKGASGDLVLRTLEPEPMHVTYRTQLPGLAPAVTVKYAFVDLAPGERRSVRRRLSYEPIPSTPPAPVPSGTLSLEAVDELGRPLPCKLTLSGIEGTPNPDFGNDGGLGGAGRFAWSGAGLLRVELPRGKYQAQVTSGFERDRAVVNVEVEAGKTATRRVALPRAFDTPGWIAADMHLHEVSSVDADVGRPERIVSVAAEGIELAVATDHYVVTDYGPTVADLLRRGELARPISTVPGSEVSTVGNRFGHFNLFPMQPGTNVRYENTTPRELFAEMRRVAPGAIIQVNHPRWPGIGYFHRYELDPKTGRVPRWLEAEYEPAFDALEVFNGLDAWSERRVRSVLGDFMHLIGRGHHYTATGNSDSHKLFFTDPGVPRTVIHYGRARHDDQDVYAPLTDVMAALRKGRAFVTSGPYLDVDLAGAGPGDTVHAAQAMLPLTIRVLAAPWVDVSAVEVLMGRDGHRLRSVPVPSSRSPLRFEGSYRVPATQKTFVVVLVKGERPLPNLYSAGVKPIAFTNPIWIEPHTDRTGSGGGRPHRTE